MNVFDVHVNRSPIAGEVADSHYVKGAFVNASLDKANVDNERLALVLNTHNDAVPQIGCVQIAGLVARRILCDVDIGDRLRAGQVYGLIRFGSRVDIWVPVSAEPMVLAGQRTLAGETILARLPAPRQPAAKAGKTAKTAIATATKKPAGKPAKASAKASVKTPAKAKASVKAPAKAPAKTPAKKAAKTAAKKSQDRG